MVYYCEICKCTPVVERMVVVVVVWPEGNRTRHGEGNGNQESPNTRKVMKVRKYGISAARGRRRSNMRDEKVKKKVPKVIVEIGVSVFYYYYYC